MPLGELKRRAGSRHPRPRTLGDRLLEALQADRGQAWRAAELARKLRADLHSVGSALRRLRKNGHIDQLQQHWFALDDREVAQRQASLWTNRRANEKWGPERAEEWPAVDLPPREKRSRRLGKKP